VHDDEQRAQAKAATDGSKTPPSCLSDNTGQSDTISPAGLSIDGAVIAGANLVEVEVAVGSSSKDVSVQSTAQLEGTDEQCKALATLSSLIGGSAGPTCKSEITRCLTALETHRLSPAVMELFSKIAFGAMPTDNDMLQLERLDEQVPTNAQITLFPH